MDLLPATGIVLPTEGYRASMWERNEFSVFFHLLQDRTKCRESAIDSFGEMGKDVVLEWSKCIS